MCICSIHESHTLFQCGRKVFHQYKVAEPIVPMFFPLIIAQQSLRLFALLASSDKYFCKRNKRKRVSKRRRKIPPSPAHFVMAPNDRWTKGMGEARKKKQQVKTLTSHRRRQKRHRSNRAHFVADSVHIRCVKRALIQIFTLYTLRAGEQRPAEIGEERDINRKIGHWNHFHNIIYGFVGGRENVNVGPFNFYSTLPDEMMNDVDKHMQMMPEQFNVHSICHRPYEIFLSVNITFLLSVASAVTVTAAAVAVMAGPENENVIEWNFISASTSLPKAINWPRKYPSFSFYYLC